MVRFRMFDPNEERFQLTRAYLVGPDDIPVAGSVVREDDLAVGTPSSANSVAMCVRCDLREPPAIDGVASPRPNVGQLTLQTCLLPSRETPYLLSLELVRHRIMFFLNKLESWQLFDLPPEHPAMERFAQAQQLFTRALVSERNASGELGEEAHTQSLAALALAIDAGEQLALTSAARQMPERLSGRAYAEATQAYIVAQGEAPPAGAPIVVQNDVGVTMPGRPAVSCAVSPSAFSDALKKAVIDTSDELVVPMNWTDLEPSEGEYSFAGTDRWIEWAVRTAKLPVAAGPVIDFAPKCVPEWLYIWENDYETLREVVYEHVKNVVTRYRRTVSRWTIVSGLHVNSHFTFNYDQLMDLTRLCVLLVRRLQPKARVFLGLDQPWGEYFAKHRQSLPPMLYADTVAQSGVVVDGYAIRLVLGGEDTGHAARDLMAVSALLDRAALLEKPIALSAIAAPAVQPSNAAAGSWRGGWDPAHQARWLEQVVAIAAAKPYAHSICWADLVDQTVPGCPRPSMGLVTPEGQPRPALAALAKIHADMKAGRSPLGALHTNGAVVAN